jgi:hypothetical protein
MADPNLASVLRYLNGAEGWATYLSQVGVDSLSHVRRRCRMRRDAVAHGVTL